MDPAADVWVDSPRGGFNLSARRLAVADLVDVAGDAREEDIDTAFALLSSSVATHAEPVRVSTMLGEWHKLFKLTPEREREQPDVEQLLEDCTRITAKGCTQPPRPHEDIVVEFTRPDGSVEYQTVSTDEFGCFETFMVTVEDGVWQVEAEYPGSRCDGPARSRPRRVTVKACDCGCDKSQGSR